MKFAVAALLTLIPNTIASRNNNDGYPDLQELFPAVPMPEVRRSPLGGKNVDFDIERIDVTKFKKKLERFAKTVTENVTTVDARRQKVPYFSSRQFSRASRHQIRAKTLDLMLQTVYMARHSIKSLEGEKYFSKTDTGFRIAFLYRRLRRQWRKIMDVYTMLFLKWDYVWYYQTEYLMIMHMKAIKLHTDYLYLWWVLIGVDGKFVKSTRGGSIKPKPQVRTTSAPAATKPGSMSDSSPDPPPDSPDDPAPDSSPDAAPDPAPDSPPEPPPGDND